MKAIYKTVLLKMSGEALSGENGFGIDNEKLGMVADEIKQLHDLGVRVAIVVGGGNFWRGRTGYGMDRATADYRGMLATTLNALALQDSIEQRGLSVRVQSPIEKREICEPYIRRKAVTHLDKGYVVIFAAGTGSPFFSTDTAASLRAAEINADIILSAKNIDGVYDSDPKKNPDAKRYDTLSFTEVLNKGLQVMDSTAASICRDNNIPLLVFNMEDPDNIVRAVSGEPIGTLVE